MNINEIIQNESNRVLQSVTTLNKLAESTDIVFSEFKDLGTNFSQKTLWEGTKSFGGVGCLTYGAYIIFKRGEPIYGGEGVLKQRIGYSGYHYKTLLGKGVPPDPKKDSFMTKAYNDDPTFKDYQVVYLIIDTGNKQSNKGLGLMIESYIVNEFNLEETGYNAKGAVDPFVIYTSNSSNTRSNRAPNGTPAVKLAIAKEFEESDRTNIAAFAREKEMSVTTCRNWILEYKELQIAHG